MGSGCELLSLVLDSENPIDSLLVLRVKSRKTGLKLGWAVGGFVRRAEVASPSCMYMLEAT